MATTTDPAPTTERRSAARLFARALLRDAVTTVALVWIVLVVAMALVPELFTTYDFLQQNLLRRNSPPLAPGIEGEPRHWLGTDSVGRDLYTRLVYGARVSMSVGAASVLLSGAFGVAVGLVAGFYGGRVGEAMMRLTDLQLAFPGLLLAMFVLFVIGSGFVNLVLVMAVLRWPVYARVTRSMTLSWRESPFVDVARTLGASNRRIMVRHLLPNLLSPLVVLATLEFARMILFEASLSFLGLGIQPPQTAWGLMIAQGRDHLRTAWWLVAFPGLMIFLTALSVNILATWARGITDPVQRWRWMRTGKVRGREKVAEGATP